MDVSVFSDFTFDNEEAFQDFLLVNGLQHRTYNSLLQQAGVSTQGYDLFDLEPTKDSRDDWLLIHYRAHQALSSVLNLGQISDLSDLEFHDDSQFENWLQLHKNMHIQLDLIFGL